MIRNRSIALLTVLLVLCSAGPSLADPIQLATLVESISLGMSLEEVTRQVPGLKEASASFKEGWKAYELPDPSGDLRTFKCAFASGKLTFFLLETREGRFAAAKEIIEKKYGGFSQPADHSVFEQKKGDHTIRLLRTGEDGTAAQIMIGNLE